MDKPESAIARFCVLSLLVLAPLLPLSCTWGPERESALGLNHREAWVEVGENLLLKAYLCPEGTQTEASFGSSDTSVATVSPEGLVSAHSLGQAVISALSEGGLEATCVVHVAVIHDVTVDLQDGSAPRMQEVLDGCAIEEPEFGFRDGFHFDGWFLDADGTDGWDVESDPVAGDMTLYAHWTAATVGLAYAAAHDGQEWSVTAGTADATGTVTVPDQVGGRPVTEVGSFGFFDEDAMTAISLPRGLRTVGEGAFEGSNNLASIGDPEGFEWIGPSAFAYCQALTGIGRHEGLRTVGQYAFDHCQSMDAVYLPHGIEAIPPYAFAGCSSLADCELPVTLKSIGNSAFSECGSLTAVSLPPSVVSIGNNAFSGSGLTEVELPAGLTALDYRVFARCSSLTSVTLPMGLETIGNSAFDSCASLREVEFPPWLRTIGDYAFYGCSVLDGISFPEGLTSIGYVAFMDCDALTEVLLPESLASMGDGAFAGCQNLAVVTALPEAPPLRPSYGHLEFFGGCPSLSTIFVPGGSVPDYQAAPGWDYFADYIQGM